MVEHTVATYGRLDMAFNNAGIVGFTGDLADESAESFDKVTAIIRSMTPGERTNPKIINGSRRARIARGSGTSVQQVNQLLQARKQMQKMMKQLGQGKMPNLQSIVAQQVRR